MFDDEEMRQRIVIALALSMNVENFGLGPNSYADRVVHLANVLHDAWERDYTARATGAQVARDAAKSAAQKAFTDSGKV